MLLWIKGRILLLGIVLWALPSDIWGQQYGVFGKVVDTSQGAVAFANVILVRASDSTFIAGTSTDELGNFAIIPLPQDQYTITVSFIGFNSFTNTFVLNKDQDFGVVILEETSEQLEEISITTKRPTVVKKPDRITFNVANTALSEGSTLQVLKSTPGVIVGSNGVTIKNAVAVVYINNKRVQLTANELIQFLESSPANAIQSVEVITNPPASYDANSGAVVNIIMSKNLIAGYRGNITTNYTQGVYPRYNLGTGHYFKNDKISFNLNYNYAKQKLNRNNLGIVNYLNQENQVTEVWTSDINRTTRSEVHNININFDYKIDERNLLSLTATGLYTPYFQYNIFNTTRIEDAQGAFLSRFTADNSSRDNKYNLGADFDYKHDFTNGSSLSFNAHYTTYDYKRYQIVDSEFFDADNSFDFGTEFNTLANQDTHIFTSKMDMSFPLDEDSGKLEFGTKFSNVLTDSDITREDIVNGEAVVDPLNSDVFKYIERVFAGYLNYTNSWDKWDLNIGLRIEQSNIEGKSLSLNESNTQNYFEWFPNISVSHSLTKSFDLYANYKRSIIRPDYTNLNPFTFFLNENTVVVGNPALTPTFLNHFILGANFLKYFTVEAYYMDYNGAINELSRQNNDTNIIAYIPVNLDKTVDYGFDFIADFELSDWWSVYVLTSFYNITEETNFDEEEVSLSRWSNYSAVYNNFYLLQDKSLSISLNMAYGNKNLQGLALVGTRIMTDLALSKTIWNDKAVISLSVEDLFNEQDFFTEVKYLNQSNTFFSDWDNRFVKLGFRYKFGNTKLSSNERTRQTQERERLE